MMDPKENDINNHLFILPDTQKEYLRQLFTKYLKQIEKSQNSTHLHGNGWNSPKNVIFMTFHHLGGKSQETAAHHLKGYLLSFRT